MVTRWVSRGIAGMGDAGNSAGEYVYVLHSDYAALESQLAEAAARIMKLEGDRCDLLDGMACRSGDEDLKDKLAAATARIESMKAEKCCPFITNAMAQAGADATCSPIRRKACAEKAP